MLPELIGVLWAASGLSVAAIYRYRRGPMPLWMWSLSALYGPLLLVAALAVWSCDFWTQEL